MNGEGQDALDGMSSEFIAEIKDDLASLEPDLLAMEEKGANVDDDLINHAFRSIHSIKGGAGFINFKALSSLSHAMENVLMRVREKSLVITSEIVDALLSGFDKMKLMVDLMGTDKVCDYEEQKLALQKILSPKVQKEDADKAKKKAKPKPTLENTLPDSGQKAKKSKKHANGDDKTLQVVKPLGDSSLFFGKAFPVDKKRLENALNSQKFVYAVHIRFENDLAAKQKDVDSIIEDIKSIGDLLFFDLENLKDKTGKEGFFCVISTILDLPLLSQVLEINRTQMALVDRQFTDYEAILKGLSPKAAVDKPKQKSFAPEEPPPKPDKASAITIPESKMEALATTQTIRISVDLISKLMNRAGELVLSRNQLRPLMEKYAQENSKASNMMQNLDMVTTDIQEAIMQMRMQPIIDLMGKYKRVVRDIARRMSKKVDFILEGADVEVDRNVLEKLANPVTHLIRNCIDHGIESPEERKKRSKPETGTISIKAFHQGGHVHIIISDDGAGIDPQLVLSKAFEKGLVSEDQVEKFTDKQKIELIFFPGFTTSEEITDISGRGVGMDVVKTNIERLRGQIEIDSVKGEGTTVHLIIPLTLAIVPSLIVSSGDARFAIPQANIKEVIFLEPGKIHNQVENIAGSEVLRLREHLLPILRLRNVLGIKTYIEKKGAQKKEEEKRRAIADRRQDLMPPDPVEKRHKKTDRRKTQWDTTYVIMLKLGVNVFGLCVDELYDIEEVVVEPLSEYIKHLKCFAGTTILGDGDVIMILDVPGIASFSSLRFDTIKSEELKRNQLKEKTDQERGEKRNLIVFSNGNKEYFALELKSVSRLEPIKPADIHYTGNLKYVEYNNTAVLLFSMNDFLPASACELKEEEIFAIFPKHISAKVGIIASKIIDTIETDEKLTRDVTCSEAVLGKIFIDKMMVQVLDHEKFATLIEHKAVIETDPL
ncbi:MAG: chemotaxis protein CheA [Proteobacteria bacterium]|nr:chemotaxis protein CheA [Pseudomonadota bacterium]MBU1581330.1 chemotaxis protein CheA [Pseudomonadota bacterium]MBU2455813.1 chemotaxis protein CheA [Pseudomonadota bacterium]MBU2631270.1 chemotaxis protein CheA [Pseudomonadota bacterium]